MSNEKTKQLEQRLAVANRLLDEAFGFVNPPLADAISAHLAQSEPQITMNPTHTQPDYQALDTYSADLLNENPPRREDITEIQDREGGALLCYANPERAAFILTACNSHAALVEALSEFMHGYIDAGTHWSRVHGPGESTLDKARAALALAKGGTQ